MMSDKFTKKKRSEIMSAIKSKDSKIERYFRSELRRADFIFRTNVTRLLGKPDIVFFKRKVVVFIDSCFWHGCARHLRAPRSNTRYWKRKIEENKRRDRRVVRKLKSLDWNVVRLWEHEIKKYPLRVLRRVTKIINGKAD